MSIVVRTYVRTYIHILSYQPTPHCAFCFFSHLTDLHLLEYNFGMSYHFESYSNSSRAYRSGLSIAGTILFPGYAT
jgi:hypothetical protein